MEEECGRLVRAAMMWVKDTKKGRRQSWRYELHIKKHMMGVKDLTF